MSKHVKHIMSKEMDINEVTILTSKELKDLPIKTDKKIISGFKKDHHNIILLSECYNETRNVPTIDLRTFSENKDTKEFVPTKRGFRLDPGAFASLISMLEDNRYMVFGITRADGSGEEEKNSNHSEHLLEQVVS